MKPSEVEHEECGDFGGVREAGEEEGEGESPARQLSGTSQRQRRRQGCESETLRLGGITIY